MWCLFCTLFQFTNFLKLSFGASEFLIMYVIMILPAQKLEKYERERCCWVMEKDLDAILWALKNLGMPRDPQSQLICFEHVQARIVSNPGCHEDFLYIVTLVYFTQGLFNTNEAISILFHFQLPQPHFTTAPVPPGAAMVGVFCRQGGLHICHEACRLFVGEIR